MKEILNFELCKRLYEAGVRVETEKERHGKPFPQNEYFYEPSSKEGSRLSYWSPIPDIPALTIVDGLELMKKEIEVFFYNIRMERWELNFENIKWTIAGNSLKECVEQSLTYLLDNNLLGIDKR